MLKPHLLSLCLGMNKDSIHSNNYISSKIDLSRYLLSEVWMTIIMNMKRHRQMKEICFIMFSDTTNNPLGITMVHCIASPECNFDYWNAKSVETRAVELNCLMPNGVFIILEAPRNATLREIKEVSRIINLLVTELIHEEIFLMLSLLYL